MVIFHSYVSLAECNCQSGCITGCVSRCITTGMTFPVPNWRFCAYQIFIVGKLQRPWDWVTHLKMAKCTTRLYVLLRMDDNGEHGMLIWIIHDNMIIICYNGIYWGLTLASLETDELVLKHGDMMWWNTMGSITNHIWYVFVWKYPIARTHD